LKAGVKEVPFDLVADRAGDEAGQYLDMITTNQHRNPLTVLEEADALFAAKQAGATRTRLRRTAVISSPLWGVSHVALRGFELRGGRVILSGVCDAPEARSRT
jgi:hypothetical protein